MSEKNNKDLTKALFITYTLLGILFIVFLNKL